MEDLKAILIFLALCIPFFIGSVWAVIDVAQKDFGSTREKAKWWIVASIPFVGFIIYLIAGFRKGKKTA
jgi:Phospholipase_D-nuclease N-terminal